MKVISTVILLAAVLFAKGQVNFQLDRDTAYVDTVFFEIDSAGFLHTKNVYAKAEFKLKNTGNSPLIITNDLGSGRGFAEYPKNPILPGETVTIKAVIYKFMYDDFRDYEKGEGKFSCCITIVIGQNSQFAQKQICVKGYRKNTKKIASR